MVKGMPFPYKNGHAMDSAYVENLRRKLRAADELRSTADRAITQLKLEMSATVALARKLDSLQLYDKKTADSLAIRLAKKQGLLTQAEADLKQANEDIAKFLAILPRRTRKLLATATPDQIAAAIVDRINTLVWRKYYWLGAGAVLGPVLIAGLRSAL
jgi:hypothetical protein